MCAIVSSEVHCPINRARATEWHAVVVSEALASISVTIFTDCIVPSAQKKFRSRQMCHKTRGCDGLGGTTLLLSTIEMERTKQ